MNERSKLIAVSSNYNSDKQSNCLPCPQAIINNDSDSQLVWGDRQGLSPVIRPIFHRIIVFTFCSDFSMWSRVKCSEQVQPLGSACYSLHIAICSCTVCHRNVLLDQGLYLCLERSQAKNTEADKEYIKTLPSTSRMYRTDLHHTFLY